MDFRSPNISRNGKCLHSSRLLQLSFRELWAKFTLSARQLDLALSIKIPHNASRHRDEDALLLSSTIKMAPESYSRDA
jgi:hypothetical protein